MKITSRNIFVSFIVGKIIFLLLLIYVWRKHVNRHEPYEIELENVLAYSDRVSYAQGDSVRVFIHATENATGKLFRLGKVKEYTGISHAIVKQIQPDLFDPFNGFSWNVSDVISTDNLNSGYYLYEIVSESDTSASYCFPIIISPKKSVDIAIIASTNTWQAYNEYGGKSNYVDNFSPWYLKSIYWHTNYKDYIPVHLPFARPYSFNNEMINENDPFEWHSSARIRSEWAIPAFLEKHNISYGVYSDMDINLNPDILNCKKIIFNVHSEYWSETMMAMLKKFMQKGGSVIWASGNNMYREVDLYDGGITVMNQKISSDITSGFTGAFSFNAEAGWKTFAPYKVVNAGHWVFKNSGACEDQIFGKYSSFSKSKEITGASGYETDKIGLNGSDFEILAIGLNKFGPAFMLYKDLPAGGFVFNASSMTFSGALTHDKVIDTVFLNLLAGKDSLK